MFAHHPNASVSVIDDDPGTCKSIASLVHDMQVPVRTFVTAEEFLAQLRHHSPGCVVTDLRMPGISGLTLLDRMRSEGSSMPLILISAYADIETAVAAMKLGALMVLEKPYRPQVLWDYIIQALKQDSEHRAAEARRTALLERIKHLSDEESTILQLMVRDVPHRAIAERLQISLRTVEFRRAQILARLRMDNLKSLIWHLGAAGWPETEFPARR